MDSWIAGPRGLKSTGLFIYRHIKEIIPEKLYGVGYYICCRANQAAIAAGSEVDACNLQGPLG